MSANPARFTFDLDLGNDPDRASYMSDAARTALQQQARADGYAEGFAGGEQSTTAAAAQAMSAAANTIADLASDMLRSLDQTRNDARREAVDLATTVGRKLASALIALQPAAELEALLVECLASLDGVPHLVIRCHPDLADAMQAIATARIATSGFAGRLIVMGDPEIATGDGRIEWSEGGLVRDVAAVSADIDTRIATYLAARSGKTTEEIA